jgi:hypothetical protein
MLRSFDKGGTSAARPQSVLQIVNLPPIISLVGLTGVQGNYQTGKIVGNFDRRITNPPQVTNLPHTKAEAGII